MSGTLSFLGDVVSSGLFWCYLLGLVPALFITVTKDLWTMFFIGVLSFGLGWFLGATSWAKPGSWWANRFYPENLEPGSSELREFLKPRRRRLIALAAATVLLVGAFTERPTVFIGTDGGSLQHSVGGSSTTSFNDECEPESDGTWTCFEYDSGQSLGMPYSTEVDWAGCWTARSLHSGRLSPKAMKRSGCVTMFDYGQPLSRIFGLAPLPRTPAVNSAPE